MRNKIWIRSLVILFWACLLFGALYLPRSCTWSAHNARTLNVFIWGDILSPALVSEFEKAKGVQVNLSYYASNEELLVKLKATESEGYDLILPSDYAVALLIKEGLVQPLDKSAFAYWEALNPSLVGRSFDPDNTYSIPLGWELYGFGMDTSFFDEAGQQPSWSLLFDTAKMNYKVAMINDPIDVVNFSHFYLFGMQEKIQPGDVEAMRDLLIQQKPFVAAYANFRADYFLATRNVPLAVASTSYLLRARAYCNFIRCAIPKEGTFLNIESFCIPKASRQEALAMEFINFFSSPSSAANLFHSYFLFPATTHAELELDREVDALLHSSKEDFARYHLVRRLLPDRDARDLWIAVKS